MDDAERNFWAALEYRVCRELTWMTRSDAALRGWWCDGFLPDEETSGNRPGGRIAGRVWMGNGPRNQEAWRFEAIVQTGSPTTWETLIPAEDVHGWLDADVRERKLHVRLPGG